MPLSTTKEKPKVKTKLSGKKWLTYSISVWDDIKRNSEERKLKHPAMFPLMLVDRLLDCYYWGDKGVVLDPFLGSGTTLISALGRGLSGVGFEIVKEFAVLSYKRLWFYSNSDLFATPQKRKLEIDILKRPQKLRFRDDIQKFFIIQNDVRRILEFLEPESIDIMITSPPYWNIHRRKRSADNKRARPYSDLDTDLGNIPSYEAFLNELKGIFSKINVVMKAGSYSIVDVMDLRVFSEFIPFHIDVIRIMQDVGFSLEDIIIWNRVNDYNNLRPLGYPYKFIVNKVHEYVLIFRKKG
ncbi:MAG: DNA methyltransferase [Candidatus Hydrothermota bacterium]|nr:MAG: DNA methyltransferase [Candidatus Hydrothermae bacterium]